MNYTWRLNILSNDAKRMHAEIEESFVPYAGMTLRGYISDHDVKVNAVVYDRKAKSFLVSLAWMSMEIPDSNELATYGWQKALVPQQANH